MWLYRSGRESPPIVLYEYQPSRSKKHPQKFLEGFKGYLCVDGYAGYNDMPGIITVCCWVHARRKFDEALKALPKIDKDKPCAAKEGFDFINKLFMIERELEKATPKERFEGRLNKTKPVLDSFNEWLRYQRPRITPKSATGEAINYCLNLWDKLEAILMDGRLYIDNNISERSIKPFVIGRKNFLFANTPKGATASAMAYSIIETAKENGLKPFEYIKYILEKLPNSDVKDQNTLDSLLPWSKELPESCKLIDKSIS